MDNIKDVNVTLQENVRNQRMLDALRKSGLRELRPVQALAMQNGLFFRRSMLVCSPSGSGKTLIGELAAVNSILEGYGKAAYLVPLKALATEKYKHFVKLYGPHGIKVEISIGDYDIPAEDLMEADLVVMTYEKMDSMLRSISGELKGVFGTIIIDEIHVVGDEGRGPRLESLIIRMARLLGDIQLIGLSATIANPVVFGEWLSTLGLNSTILVSTKRPVPLFHQVMISRDDIASIQDLLRNVVDEGGQCLVFTRSRRKAELLARDLSIACKNILSRDKYSDQVNLAFKIKRANRFSDLPQFVLHGVSYHHAGLSFSERELVEYAFKNRIISVICCTTTLSAGINMPARLVVLQDYKQYQALDRDVADKKKFHASPSNSSMRFKPISRNTFHQILGRAGRAGFDVEGDAYIFCRSTEEKRWIEERYFGAEDSPKYDSLSSMLKNRNVMLEQLLINVHEVGRISYKDLKGFFKKTFFSYLLNDEKASIDTILKMKNMTARDLLQQAMDEIQDVKINNTGLKVGIYNASKERISGYVQVSRLGPKHECQLSVQGGIDCSCLGGKPEGGAPSLACIHLKMLIHDVLIREPKLEPALDKMVLMAFKEYCYVDYLIDNSFIKKEGDDVFNCTPFGRLVTRLYIYPTTAVLVKRELLGLVASGSHETEDLTAWAFRLVKKINEEQDHFTKDALYLSTWHWMNEEPMEVVMEPSKKKVNELPKMDPGDVIVYPGDFNNFKNIMERWVRIIGKIALFLEMVSIGEHFVLLEKRIEQGIKLEILQLIEGIKGVGRIRGRILFNAGYKSVDIVKHATPNKLHKDTGFPKSLCEKLIRSALNCHTIN
ncbi:MAG: DEAD/DEAH box helicase [Candidatus Hodarchaeota archaeon]